MTHAGEGTSPLRMDWWVSTGIYHRTGIFYGDRSVEYTEQRFERGKMPRPQIGRRGTIVRAKDGEWWAEDLYRSSEWITNTIVHLAPYPVA